MKTSRSAFNLLPGAALGALVAASAPVALGATKYFDAAGGPAPWDTTTANWGNASGGPYASLWTNGSDALFEGTGGTVNVASVSAGDLTFNAAGYTLSGGTVNVAGSTLNANQPVTISSVLAGSGPLTLAADLYAGPGLAVAGPTARTDGPYVIGNVFSLDNDVTLTALGVYAGGPTSGTLAKAAEAGVWDSGGALIASIVVPVGTAISADGYAYADIIPVVLPAGTGYTMGAQAGGGTFNDFFDNGGGHALQPISGLGVTPTGAVFKGSGATFGRPTSNGGLAAGRWGAANLRISVNGIAGLPNQPVTFAGLNTYSGDTDVSGSLIFASSSPQTWAGAITGQGSVTQSGTGTLTLAADNLYTGTTTIDAGSTLVIGGAGTLGNGVYGASIANNGSLNFNTSVDQTLFAAVSGSGNLIQNGSGTLFLASGVSTFSGDTTVNAGILELGGTAQINNSHTITVASGATLKLNGTINNQLQAGLYPSPPPTSSLVIHGTLEATVGANAHTVYCPIVTLNGGTITGGTGHATYGMFYFRSDRTITANGAGNSITCGTVGINAFPGQITTLTLDTPLAGDQLNATTAFIDANGGTGAKIVKAGAGTVTLAGANTYLGTTTVNAGTLEVTGSLRLQPTTNGSVNTIGGTANLVINGSLDLDLATANITDGNAWLLVDAANLSESYGAGFGVSSTAGAFAETGLNSGVWTLESGSNLWTFTESTGSLALEVTSGYQAWIDSFVSLTGADKLPGADPDNDGMSNLDEFAFKGDPTTGSNHGLIAVAAIDGNSNTTRELTLTVAVRSGAVFAGSPSPTATIDGVTYTIEGSLNLNTFDTGVTEITALSPAQSDLPDITGSGWTYHSFMLDGSEGLTGKGFLRAKTEAAP